MPASHLAQQGGSRLKQFSCATACSSDDNKKGVRTDSKVLPELVALKASKQINDIQAKRYYCRLLRIKMEALCCCCNRLKSFQ